MGGTIIEGLYLLWEIITDNRVEEAKATAAMWQSYFWVAVIVIGILTFIIIRERIKDNE